jgi:hypothetical protein
MSLVHLDFHACDYTGTTLPPFSSDLGSGIVDCYTVLAGVPVDTKIEILKWQLRPGCAMTNPLSQLKRILVKSGGAGFKYIKALPRRTNS